MTVKTRQRVLMPNMIPPAAGIAGASTIVQHQSVSPVVKEVVRIPSVAVAMVDGGVNGSIGSLALLTLPAKGCIVLGTMLNLAIVGSGGVVSTATIKLAVGTAAETTSDSMIPTAKNIMQQVFSNPMVTSSTTVIGPAAPTVPFIVNALTGTQQVFLNFGIADAGSTANGTLTITGSITLAYAPIE